MIPSPRQDALQCVRCTRVKKNDQDIFAVQHEHEGHLAVHRRLQLGTHPAAPRAGPVGAHFEQTSFIEITSVQLGNLPDPALTHVISIRLGVLIHLAELAAELNETHEDGQPVHE